MARKIPNNPLFDADEERKALGIDDIEKTEKRGRPVNNNLIRDNSTQAGLTADWTRASFIVREEYLNKLKDYAYTERISIKEALDRALGEFLKDKHDLLQHK